MQRVFFFIIAISSLNIHAQNTLQGVVIDKKTQETLIGANVTLSTNLNNQSIVSSADSRLIMDFLIKPCL